jgi:hypothetical protein
MEEQVLTPHQQRVIEEHAAKIHTFRLSIREFIREQWGLVPQPVRPEFKEQWDEVCRSSWKDWEKAKKRVQPEWFGKKLEGTGEEYEKPEVWYWYDPEGYITTRQDFIKKKYISWQQTLILLGVEKAMSGDGPKKITTVSGHGIGKSAVCSWIILWFLYCFMEAQVPVTAPTSSQMHDVLWKELSIWINRMPEDTKELYHWQTDYIRMNYMPESWFARARTSTKENTEAIAGVHSDHVAIVVDEASGVPEQVFETAQGALTSGNVLIIMISNGTRTIGYFYDSHHKNAEDWQCASFNCEQSPVVDPRYPEDMAKQYGYKSQEYKIRVSGGFPDEDTMDDSGYVQLISQKKIRVRVKGDLDVPFVGRKILGVDPSGEGKDQCTFVLRDRFKAEVVLRLNTTNDKEIAENILTLIEVHKLHPNDVVVASFGAGADVGKEVAIASRGEYEIYTVMEGNTPEREEEYNGKFFKRKPDELQNPRALSKKAKKVTKIDAQVQTDLYMNIRALMNHRMAKWLIAGGVLVDVDEQSEFAEQVARNRWKRSLQGNKIQMMPKKEMLKLRIKSPNDSDALALTTLRDLDTDVQTIAEAKQIEEENESMETTDELDRFSSV